MGRKWTAFKSFLNTPLGVACVSQLLFALAVVCVGTFLQNRNWNKQENVAAQNRRAETAANTNLQHAYWKEQEKIARENRRTDLIFEKRSEILEKYANTFMMRTQNIWNIRNLYDSLEKAFGDKSEFVRISEHLAKCGVLDQEFIAKMISIETLEACYLRTSDIPLLFKQLRNILHDIVFNFQNEHMTIEQLKENRTIAAVNAKMSECDEINNRIVSRMLNVIYSK